MQDVGNGDEGESEDERDGGRRQVVGTAPHIPYLGAPALRRGPAAAGVGRGTHKKRRVYVEKYSKNALQRAVSLSAARGTR